MFCLIEGVGVSLIYACPGCKDALATEGAMALARGYYWSILLLLLAPFILVGIISFLVYRSYRLKLKSSALTVVSSPASH